MNSDLEGFWQGELQRFLPDPAGALDDALQYVCCPVCQVLVRVPYDFFRFLSLRWPDEPVLREVVIQAGGFCRHHSWRLSSIQSMLPIARVFVDVIAALAEREPMEVEPCPVCELEAMATDLLFDVLIRRLEDPAEREWFGQLFGLCYPHYRALLTRELPSSLRDALVQSQSAQARLLQEHLKGFIDKDTVDLKYTRTHEESRSSKHALLKTAGNENV